MTTDKSPKAANKPAKRRAALGRGLSSLIPSAPGQNAEVPGKGLKTIAVVDILPGDGQPRQNFDETALDELAASIREHGILQPVVVRQRKGGQYEIIAGERRWRASQRAGLKKIPCVVTDIADDKVLTVALVENVQRQDLNPIEEAEAYRRLSDELSLTQEAVAEAVGKSRSAVTNTLRLLRLPDTIRAHVIGGELSMGHARALLSLEADKDMERASREVLAKALNVRSTESMVRRIKAEGAAGEKPAKKSKEESPEERDVRLRLERTFGTRVELSHNKGKGKFAVHFESYDQLEELMRRLGA